MDYNAALEEAKKLVALFSGAVEVIGAAIEAQALIAESKPERDKFIFEKQTRENQLKKLQQEFESRQAEIAQAEKDLKSLKDAHAVEAKQHAELKNEYERIKQRIGL